MVETHTGRGFRLTSVGLDFLTGLDHDENKTPAPQHSWA